MDLGMLRDFFMWCLIINAGLLVGSMALCLVLRDLIYKIHSALFPMSREEFNRAIYMLFTIYKILLIVFAAVPYVAILILMD
jgi:hypothetical protein